MKEIEVFELIKNTILSIQKNKIKPICVAINGIEGTGKTTMTEKLTKFLNHNNIHTIHVSIDGFHNKKESRYKQGRDSAKGYYEDSYNENEFIEKVLKSSQSNSPNITNAIHDLESNEDLDLESIELNYNTVLITDGAYLFKKIYRNYWDLKIYLKTSFEIALERGIDRDKDLFGGVEKTKEKYEKRYHQSSKIYNDENCPEDFANIIIDNSDFDNLKILKNLITNKN
ncbi:MAG: hypothetical protein R2739_02200 [Chitinophagales bacterium]